MADRIKETVQQFHDNFFKIKAEIQKQIVGQDEIIENVLICLLADGHALIEGVPGLGKTQLVHALADVLGLKFKRIQFTPDMMPSDITGTTLLIEDSDGRKSFEFQRGPIFAQIILADEINRTTPRTQSALLEAMQERTVSVARTTHRLDDPFCVLATQNPIEMDGTYPLPEAQLDRFFFKILIDFPSESDLLEILNRTTSSEKIELSQVVSDRDLKTMRDLVHEVLISEHVAKYAIKLVTATHPDQPNASENVKKFVELGASIRGLQAITLAAKVKAILDKRFNIAIDDICSVSIPALRHRILINFEGQSESITPDQILSEILEK